MARRLGAGVTGLVLIDDADAVLVERLSESDADIWRQAGFRIVEPDGRHVLKGIFEWLASSKRQGNCLAIQLGKASIAPALRLCQPPFDAAVCIAGDTFRFDVGKVLSLSEALRHAGPMAVAQWKSYQRDSTAAAMLSGGTLRREEWRRLFNMTNERLAAQAGVIPDGLDLPFEGSGDYRMLDAVLRDVDPLPLCEP